MTHEDMVREFMVKHSQLRANIPTLKVPEQVKVLRMRLITEEFAELVIAIHEGDLVKVADALADLDYVVTGTAVAFGIPHEVVFREVHRSNMTKPKLDENDKGGKVAKLGYEKADIEPILEQHGAIL